MYICISLLNFIYTYILSIYLTSRLITAMQLMIRETYWHDVTDYISSVLDVAAQDKEAKSEVWKNALVDTSR